MSEGGCLRVVECGWVGWLDEGGWVSVWVGESMVGESVGGRVWKVLQIDIVCGSRRCWRRDVFE